MDSKDAELVRLAQDFADIYPQAFLLLDTNLLTIYPAEEISPHFSRNHQRLSDYSALDRLFLKSFVAAFEERLITLPHILAETGNLIDPDKKLTGDFRIPFMKASTHLAEQVIERQIPFTEIVPHPLYLELGTTDAAIACLAQQAPYEVVVMSADHKLALQWSAWGVESIYFPDIRLWN